MLCWSNATRTKCVCVCVRALQVQSAILNTFVFFFNAKHPNRYVTMRESFPFHFFFDERQFVARHTMVSDSTECYTNHRSSTQSNDVAGIPIFHDEHKFLWPSTLNSLNCTHNSHGNYNNHSFILQNAKYEMKNKNYSDEELSRVETIIVVITLSASFYY